MSSSAELFLALEDPADAANTSSGGLSKRLSSVFVFLLPLEGLLVNKPSSAVVAAVVAFLAGAAGLDEVNGGDLEDAGGENRSSPPNRSARIHISI